MDISEITKNKTVISRLESGKLFHAYIISGPVGSGKHRLAEYISAMAVCSAPQKKPCNICPNCKKAFSGIHPDIITVDREKDKREHSITAIRTMRADASVIPNDADKKVYIINDADCLNIPSQNAILKLLEEPPSYAVFILIAKNSGELLDTVRSRCIKLSLTPEKNGQEVSDDARQLADEFFDVMSSGDKFRITEFLFSLDSIGKNELADLALAVKTRVVEEIRKGADGRGKMSLGELTHISDVFDKILKNIDFNVGTGHNIGYMMSEFI